MNIVASPLDVEAAVVIQEAKFTLLGENTAKAEVARRIFPVRLLGRCLQLRIHLRTIFSGNHLPVKTLSRC